MQDTHRIQETYPQEGIDSKAYLLCFLRRIPYMLLIGLTGAIIGSGLYLLIAAINNRTTVYMQETEYYIDFAPGRIDAKDYYNAFTWNDVMGTDLIMDTMMEVLGDTYSRESVKEMITADILSDVRYLTITVQGEDEKKVEAVSSAVQEALTALGSREDLFDSITLIEDNGVKPAPRPYFTWRATFLGFLIAVCIEIFRFSICFGIEDTFYTKKQIRQRLNIPVLGLWYQLDNHHDGEEELQTSLAVQSVMNQDVIFVDIINGNYAEQFYEQYTSIFSSKENGSLQTISYPIIRQEEYDKLENANVILVIPFGVPCANQAEDIVCELQRRNCHIAGAVLTNCNYKWVKAYYNKFSTERGK